MTFYIYGLTSIKTRVHDSLFQCFFSLKMLEDFPIHPYISLFSPFLVCSLKTKFFCSVRAFQKGSRRFGKHHRKQCDINAQTTTICYVASEIELIKNDPNLKGLIKE